MRLLSISLAIVSLVSTASLAAADNAVAPTPPPLSVQIEVVDGVAGTAPSAPSFVGALTVAFGDCGTVEAGNPTGHYIVKACYQRRNGAPNTLSLEFDRTISGHSELHQKLQSTSAIALGQRVVVGRFGSGADSTEVAATMK